MIIPQFTQYLDSDEPIMVIDSQIGYDTMTGEGINGHDFAKELMWLDTLDKKRICIYINSPGGVVDEGFSIFNAILQTETPVDTYNIGIAASTAGWIFEAGRVRYMNDYAKIMIHNPFIDGDATSSDKKALREIKHSICVALASRSGHTEQEIAALMDKETWINAEEAVAQGFADEIRGSADFNKKKSITAINVLDAWKEGAKIFNRSGYIKIKGVDTTPVINTKNKNSMSKILAKSLGLAEDATEEQILAAVTNLKAGSVSNKIKNDDDEGDDDDTSMDDLSARMDDMEKKIGKGIDDMKAKHDDLKKAHGDMSDKFGVVFDELKTRMDDMEKKMDDAGVTYDNKVNEVAAALINKYVSRIGTDAAVISNWMDKAKKDVYATEHELQQLPLNIKSPAKEALVTTTIVKNEIPVGADANTMAEWYARRLREKLSK